MPRAISRPRRVTTDTQAPAGKPPQVVEKIVDGKIAKWKKENCLVDQLFVKNTEITVGDLVKSLTGTTGEKITVRRFVRFEVGEGLEKRTNDLAAEVAAMTGGNA